MYSFRQTGALKRAEYSSWKYALVVLALLPSLIEGQSAPTLRLESVYQDLKAVNPRVRGAEALAKAARSRVLSAGLPPDPQFQFGWMNYVLPSLKPMEVLGMKQFQVMQMLPLGGKLRLSKNIARARADAELERSRDTWWEIRAQAAMPFYELYRIDQSLVVMRETVRLLEDTREVAQSMYRVGNGNQVDVIRAQVEIARMTEDTIRMQTMRTAMAARLNALLDRSHDTRTQTPQLPAYPQVIPSLDSLQLLAQRNRPMLKAGEAEVSAAQSMQKLARKELFPDLQVGVQYGRQPRVPMSGETTRAAATQQMPSLMLGATIPIWARSRQLLARQETEAIQQMAQAELRAMQADTHAAVAERYAELLRARRLAGLYRNTIIPQARAALSSAFGAYRVGKVDFMTLLDNQMTVNNYRQELATLDADEGRAWADLEMLVGGPLVPLSDNNDNAATPGIKQ